MRLELLLNIGSTPPVLLLLLLLILILGLLLLLLFPSTVSQRELTSAIESKNFLLLNRPTPNPKPRTRNRQKLGPSFASFARLA